MAAAYAIESLGLSERRACLLTGISPSVYRYRSKQGDVAALRRRMRELAGERKRFGSPRLHIMLKREGLVINHKRTERIYSEEGLALRRKRRRKARQEPGRPFHLLCVLTRGGPWTLSLTALWPVGASGHWP